MSALTTNIKNSEYDSITIRRPRSPTATIIGQEIVGLVQENRRVYPELVEYMVSTRAFDNYFVDKHFQIPKSLWKMETGLSKVMVEVLDANLNTGNICEINGTIHIMP
jgi:hypothetical protein